MLIDAHCHLDFAAFDPDRDAVIEAARGVGVKHFIVPGTTRARWQSVLALGQCRADISVCAGLHPYFIAEHREQDINQLDSVLSEHPELVAVGECGIDGRFDDTLAAQWDYFDAQLTLAKQHGLPIVVHCVKANDTVAKRLRQRALARAGLIHAFAGSYEQAKKFVDLGYVLGLGGAATYRRAKRLQRVIKALPDDSFVLETDSPDMPLSGYQGQRNEPCRVSDVCKVVAGLRGQTCEHVAAISSANAARMFRLPTCG
ncbi:MULTISPECIES: TatD family hydrolase [unclassified Halomonas]|uniref:TatD family hydrolase n=1 Tax=unclassified Halomonas TaxID=2609666 RepID=UPI0006DAE8BA|nr:MULTISPECIES: TatD family hydrolase [unclassified Halomonas]KPQ18918.1 MAG: TatD DNase family protein YjjV [Halomonas sp. HL-93]SBR48901.1 TatD DNase family protein [Halomonas sp. HL-93]SNY96053.1 TatD DNase family protein [Halomonas sp. hl-4]